MNTPSKMKPAEDVVDEYLESELEELSDEELTWHDRDIPESRLDAAIARGMSGSEIYDIMIGLVKHDRRQNRSGR